MMNEHNELVSIIMPAFNAGETLSVSIESVISQSIPDWVLYVIDDASTDNTSEIIRKYAVEDNRIIYIGMQYNSGVAAARNAGLSAAKGKYIAFLDSDDIWLTHKLKSQVEVLDSGFDVVCSNYKTFFGDITNEVTTRKFPKTFEYKHMLKGNKIGNLTGIYNQEKISKVYQSDIGHEDYVMWLDIVNKTKRVYCIQEVLAYYRLSEKSLSANKIKASLWQWKVYRVHLKLGFFKSMYYWLSYAFNVLHR